MTARRSVHLAFLLVFSFCSGLLLAAGNHITITGSVGYGNSFLPCFWQDKELNLLPLGDGNVQGEAFGIARNGNGARYIAGYVLSSDGAEVPCYWKDGGIVILPRGSGNANGNATVVTLDGSGAVLVAGHVRSSQVRVPCYWKDGALTLLPTGDGNPYGNADDVKVDLSGNVYVAGAIGKDYSSTVPCFWKNGVLVLLPRGSGVSGEAFGIVFDDAGSQFVVGEVTASVTKPCYWKNGSLTLLAMDQITGDAYGIAVDSSGLYVAGAAEDSACFWKDGEPTLLPAENAQAEAFSVAVDSDGSPWMVGFRQPRDDASGSMTAPCYWTDGAIAALPMGEGNNHGQANDVMIGP